MIKFYQKQLKTLKYCAQDPSLKGIKELFFIELSQVYNRIYRFHGSRWRFLKIEWNRWQINIW